MMIIIAHHHFNKSLTLDMKKYMHYLSSKDNTRLYNRSTNPQNSLLFRLGIGRNIF